MSIQTSTVPTDQYLELKEIRQQLQQLFQDSPPSLTLGSLGAAIIHYQSSDAYNQSRDREVIGHQLARSFYQLSKLAAKV